MYIQRIPPGRGFTRTDNKVIQNMQLSDGAFRLYCYLIMVPPSVNYDNQNLMQALGLSERALSNRKAELKKADLLCIEQIGPRIYHAYMGDMTMSASMVRTRMKREDLMGGDKNEND